MTDKEDTVEKTGYLLVMDFDGTCANTFQKSPGGIGVREAYALAVEAIFGDKGLEVYESIGGLQNRAPVELVSALLLRGSEKLLGPAERYFDTTAKTLNASLMPKGKGAPLEWRLSSPDIIKRTIAEMLVLAKLSFLMDEIGKTFPNGLRWPQPCMGFLSFMESLDFFRNEKGLHIDVAIVSSGHDRFIHKTFLMWEINSPQITVTDDDMRDRRYPEEVEKRYKPSPFLFDLVHSEWIGDMRHLSQEELVEIAVGSRRRMMYFGDDPNKDGGLARNAGVPFGLFSPDNSCVDGRCSFKFSDWSHVSGMLYDPEVIEGLLAGRSLADIFG